MLSIVLWSCPEKKAIHFSPLALQCIEASPGVKYHLGFPPARTTGMYGEGKAEVLFSTH